MEVVRDHATMASSKTPPAAQPRPPSFVTHSRVMARAVALADRVAMLGAPALVVGEGGTGKRRLLRRISLRPDAPSRPESVIDCKRSRHAFTSALERLADVNHPMWRMPTRLQLIGLDLLDVEQLDALVQTIWGHFYLCSGLQILATSEVGADELASSSHSAARIVAAAANEIAVPPLRERGADVPLLAHAILRRQCANAGIARLRVASDASELLRLYPWPSNFPELEEVLGWATTTADPTKRYIFAHDLPPSLQDDDAVDPSAMIPRSEEGLTLPEIEKRHILAALERFGGCRRDVARALAISENTLWRRLRAYGVVGPTSTPPQQTTRATPSERRAAGGDRGTRPPR